jgi:hypothetical protein
MISTLVALPYEIARLPIALADRTLSDRLSETSPSRIVLDRALGSADRIAGRLTGNQAIAHRGAERLARLDERVTASRLERDAEQKRERAEEALDEGRAEAAEKRQAAQQRLASVPEKAEAVERRATQEAKGRARAQAADKKAAADERAVTVVESAEQQRKRKEAAAAARKKAAQRRAQAKAAKAGETEASAAEARADADRLEDLAETTKQERTQD